MGQKVNPHGIRVGVIKDWDSKWYAEADFADNLVEDYNIRKFLKKKLYSAGIAKIEIERASDKVKVIITQLSLVSLLVRAVLMLMHSELRLRSLQTRSYH